MNSIASNGIVSGNISRSLENDKRNTKENPLSYTSIIIELVTKEKKLNSTSSIEVTNLTKRYRLGTIGMTSLREDISRWWHSKNKSRDTETQIRKLISIEKGLMQNGEFLALSDVSFSVKKGEVIGIIGANGLESLHYLKFYHELQNHLPEKRV